MKLEITFSFRTNRDACDTDIPIWETEVQALETDGELVSIWSEHSREQRFEPDIVINVNDVLMIEGIAEGEEK